MSDQTMENAASKTDDRVRCKDFQLRSPDAATSTLTMSTDSSLFGSASSPPSTPIKPRTPQILRSKSSHSSLAQTLLGSPSIRSGIGGYKYPPQCNATHECLTSAQFDGRWQGDSEFPPDEPGEEMASHSRVWRVYMHEGSRFDADMIDGMNHSLDVLLVFAGLFSAVVTTFLVQSSTSLQPDYTQVSASLLLELISLQRAAAQGIPLASIPTSQGELTSFKPASQNRWINGLWYISLVCSLFSALMCMLVKQWLQAYVHGMTGSPQERARLRHFRYIGLQRWHVHGMVGGLPVLMHTSLLLFFLGLIQLLNSLDQALSLVLTCVVASAYTVYLAITILPLIYPQCPYKTPLVEYFLEARVWLIELFIRAGQALRQRVQGGSPAIPHSSWTVLPTFASHSQPFGSNSSNIPKSLKEAEWAQIRKHADLMDAQALSWLFTESTDEAVIAVALQALAGLRHDFQGYQILRERGALDLVERAFQTSAANAAKLPSQTLDDLEIVGRYGRALLHLANPLDQATRLLRSETIRTFRRMSQVKDAPDVAVLSSCALIRHSEFGTKTINRGITVLQQIADGQMVVSTPILIMLLESISTSVVVWGVPADGNTRLSDIHPFFKLMDAFQPTLSSSLGKAVATAFYLSVTPTRDLDDNRSLEFYRTQDPHILMIRAYITVLELYNSEPNIILAVTRLTSIALEAVTSDGPVSSDSLIVAEVDATIPIIVDIFASGRVRFSDLPEATTAGVLLLFSRSQQGIPCQHPSFLRSLICVLGSAEFDDTILRALFLIRECLTNCSLELCRDFIDSDGLEALLKYCSGTGVSKLTYVAGLAICAFSMSVTLSHRKNENVERELDYLFQSAVVSTICKRSGSQRLSLFDIQKNWLPALLSLCRIRPKDPVWVDALHLFIEPVTELIKKEAGLLLQPDEPLLALGRSVILGLEEMKDLIGVEITPCVTSLETDGTEEH